MSHRGRFVWRELVTPSPADAGNFYAQLLGWSTHEVDMGFPYVMMRHDDLDEEVAGAMAPPMEGIPAHWLDYVTVDDVDAALATARELGGSVVSEPHDIPVGRFAIVRDPSGAPIALFTSATPRASDTERDPPVGTFCWSHLSTTDLDAATPFYEQVLGWTAARQEDGSVWFMQGEAARASATPKADDDDSPSGWLSYIAVDDADAHTDRAKQLGARVIVEPTDMPGMGRFSVLADPSGAVFAVWKDASTQG